MKNKKLKIAIIIPAFKTEKYILHTLDSIKKQNILDNFEIDIRIGVDGCEKTAEVLKNNKIKFWMSFKNKGVAVMRNSLLYLSPADLYMIFDSDDIMLDDYIFKNVITAVKHGACRALAIRTDENLKSKKIGLRAMGAITITHQVLTQIGGYRNYRIFEDKDFYKRIEGIGIDISYPSGGLFLRRTQPNSITQNKNKMDKDYLDWILKDINNYLDKKDYYVKPELTELVYIDD
jgi:glycosyltransferase involved in cell wall biosynthesis